jgi:hypothetical protein
MSKKFCSANPELCVPAFSPLSSKTIKTPYGRIPAALLFADRKMLHKKKKDKYGKIEDPIVAKYKRKSKALKEAADMFKIPKNLLY